MLEYLAYVGLAVLTALAAGVCALLVYITVGILKMVKEKSEKKEFNYNPIAGYPGPITLGTSPWDQPEVKEACARFHPGEKCEPGRNHPGAMKRS